VQFLSRRILQTKAWVELNAAMAPYYRIDRKKKIAAAIIIQRWVRHVQKKVFSYSRMMRTIDEVVNENLEKIRAKALAAKMLATAPEPGSLEARSVKAASLADKIALAAVSQVAGLPPPEAPTKQGLERRRRSEIISDFKRKQRNRISILVRPITAGANFADKAAAAAGVVFAPRPTQLLSVLCTPPQSPRGADPKVDTYRVVQKPVSLDNPAPFTGGLNSFLPTSSNYSSNTFLTNSGREAGVVSPANLLHQISEKGDDTDTEDEEEDDGTVDEGGFIFTADEDECSDDEHIFEVQHENMHRGESAPQLSRLSPTYNNMKLIKQSLVTSPVKLTPHQSSGARRAKSAKIARDESDIVKRPPHGNNTMLSQSMKEFRPSTASAAEQSSRNRTSRQQPHEYSIASFSLDQDKKYKPVLQVVDAAAISKLPLDVISDPCKHLSMDRGLRFLRAVSADSKKYDDLVVKRRTHR
jgi:hypothetical protein